MGTEVGLVLPAFSQLEESPPLGLSLSSDHTDTWAPSICLSSSSSLPCLSPPLPPSVRLDGVLAEEWLVLDVYQGGGEVLPVFWECVQERMRGLQYLTLGSEDEGALERALSVLPRLTQLLHCLSILFLSKGHCFHDPQGDPLPGLLSSLPDSVSSLSLLVHLDLSFNRLSSLPPGLLSLFHLSELLLCHNRLTDLPEGLGALESLRRVSLLGNRLVDLPRGVGLLCRLEELDVSFNQLERLPDELSQLQDLQKLELSNNRLRSLCVFHITKHGKVMLQFAGLMVDILRALMHTCILLSVCLQLACCSVSQFSWFVAISRPFLDSCSVSPDWALLVSQSDPGIKLTFPPECTTETRTVTMQVLQVALSEVQEPTGDPHASASPMLCLSQTPSMHFLQPIRVQIPLPPGVTGHMVDMSRLHLMHGDPTAHTWTDITAQVSLYVTHIYAVFSITNFSWYWLWYTTHRCVSGVVRKMYHRLKQFRVRFLALQRKNDPEQVLLQCLPLDRVRVLYEKYEGPQPSELCVLLKGEQFFAGFERGIDINADRPDCKDGRLSFTFYSHLKHIKEVHVCPTHPQQGTVRGQVSFYRGEVPSDEEAASKRKGHDNQWMATLPLRISGPRVRRKRGENADCDGSISGELNLGDPESGYLTLTNLLPISLRINQEWQNIGINLGISYDQLERIRNQHRDFGAQVLAMLFHWARGQQGAGPGAVQRLMKALVDSGRRDLAEEVEDIVTLGKRKYEESLKRVGLETAASSPLKKGHISP
uniref:Leucine-rich repeat protein SHOC-2 n=1 Tax=Cyprinus carpio carpio TaxID=630221 RepID=A0A9J8DCQ6_CYPCA